MSSLGYYNFLIRAKLLQQCDLAYNLLKWAVTVKMFYTTVYHYKPKHY